MLWFVGIGDGCYTFSLILGLRTLVLKAGPNVSRKWVFYLTPQILSFSSSLFQLPQAGLEPRSMRGDHSRWLQHGGEDSTSTTTYRAHSIPGHLGLPLILLSHVWVTEGPTEVLRQPCS